MVTLVTKATMVILLTKAAINICRPSDKVPVISDCNQIWIFSTEFVKHNPPPNTKFHENPLCRSWFFHLDGQTEADMSKLTFVIHNFVNVPNNTLFLIFCSHKLMTYLVAYVIIWLMWSVASTCQTGSIPYV
jgi:hypothetical protein